MLMLAPDKKAVPHNQDQAGFTLVEVILVVAISAALGSMVLFGQGEVRERAQFSNGIERVKNSLVAVKNEANTTVNASMTSSGTNTSQIVYGKLVIFTNNRSTMEVYTLLAACETSPPSPSPSCEKVKNDLVVTDPTTIQIPWGIEFDEPASDADAIVFVRAPATGELTTYVPPVQWNYPGLLDDADRYRPDDITVRRNAVLKFRDVTGHRATLEVKAAITADPGEGLITRRFDN